MTSKGDEGVPGMASRRVRELRGLQQGLVHLQSSHPSMSLPPPSWHRRFLVLLDSGLLSFDPCASPGTPVCHIKARDVLGARFSLSDPSGCTLDVLIASPHGPATLHLYSSAARRWLQMLQDLFLRDCIDTEVWRSNDDNNIHPVCTKSSEILESSSQSIAEAQTMMPKSLEGDQRSSADIMLLEDRITNSGGMIALNQLESSTSFQRNQSAQRHLGGTEIEGQLVHSAFTKDESKLCAGIEVPEHRDRLIRDGRTASLNSERDQIEICRRFSSRLPVHCDAQVTEEKLSLVGIPGNSLHIHQDSSEESISGLTLTSDSSESQESSNLNEYNHEANSVNKYMLQEQVDDCDDEDAPLHSRIHSGEEVRRLNQVATTCHNVISKAKEDSCVLTYQKSIAEYDLYGSSEMMKMSSRFLKRSYLHIRINECWLNEAVLEESLQEGFKAPISFYNIIACLYHGGEKLAQSIELSTTFVLGCTNLRWNELLTFPILLVDLPQKEVRLNLALYRGALCGTDQVQSSMVGWTNFCFVNETGVLEIKKHLLRLWKDPPFYSCGTFAENTSEEFCGVLSVELDYNAYCTSLHQEDFVESDEDDDPPTPTDEEMDLLESITSISDVITPPTEAEKHVLWQLRHALVNNPHALPRFLMSVPWSTHRCVKETHRILEKWKPIQPFSALQLLGPQFGDKVVRSYAVERLRTISDDEFLLILIQVVQTGLQVPFFQPRFEFALEELLKSCKQEYIDELSKQDDFVKALIRIANSIKPVKAELRKRALHKMLSKIQFTEPISLPLNPRLKISGFEVEKCKYMDSKKMPLWLVLKNDLIQAEPIYTMFKAGDDLRQDMLTLQLMKIMEKIWLKSDLDLRMNVYSCVSTGLSDGFLEIVQDAETLSNIALKYGGGAKAVFRVETLQNWLVSNNRTGEDYSIAVDNFVRSCAAYCVATCVLGIGDRHNDNVMIKKTGEFFHIDFGHILGHFKSKFGFKRERARFVFTPDMAYVMGGLEDQRFKQFQEFCGLAFNKIRESAHLFLNLTHLMVSSGIPEISTPQNVHYLRDILVLDLTEEEAQEKFNEWIIESLHTKATQVNYAIHTWAHG